jgi:predicted transcriptional regulator
MIKPRRITDSELEILQLLWEESPLAAAEVASRTEPTRAWSITTVKTMLSRLVEKGAIAATAEGRRFLYSPLLARDDFAAGRAGGLVDRLFGGRVSPLVAQLAEEREIDPDDLAELEALVRRLRQ